MAARPGRRRRSRWCAALMQAALVAPSCSVAGACASAPTLTLAASTSLRARHDPAGRAQVVTARLGLGWTARARSGEPAPLDETVDRDPLVPASANASACAWTETCRWELAQRSAAWAQFVARGGERP